MLPRLRPLAANASRFISQCSRHTTLGSSRRYSSAASQDKPLRILFCGSDEFSITSLRALYHYSRLPTSNVASIDVATRSSKRTGRGMKNVVSPPVLHAAEQLMLPVHQFDTFRGWNLPITNGSAESQINMVIAVSFGLFVPRRILEQCEFGGLNVHPSLLPDLKGSSPIEHAIMYGYDRTGVTIQTLHPSRFDEGNLVLQTPLPGVAIPDPETITSLQLRDILAEIGAELLIRSLKEERFLTSTPPISRTDQTELRMARKLTPETRHVDLTKMSATQILRLNRAVGGLWSRLESIEGTKGLTADTRISFDSDLKLADITEIHHVSNEHLAGIESGLPFVVLPAEDDVRTSGVALLVKAADGALLSVPRMTISGLKPSRSSDVAVRVRLFDEPVMLGDSGRKLYKFRTRLA